MHAADQLAEPDCQNATVAENGLHPALATLELLMYPPTLNAHADRAAGGAGQVQVSPADLPLVLLVWGKSRVVPVKLTSFAISEEAFDTRLNPIAAKVELGMQVLTYMEFSDSSIGRDAFIAYQKSKENLARRRSPRPAQPQQPAAALTEDRSHRVLQGQPLREGPHLVAHRQRGPRHRATRRPGSSRRHRRPSGTACSTDERLDHIAWQHYRDPERYWRICDANRALWPDDLLEEARC